MRRPALFLPGLFAIIITMPTACAVGGGEAGNDYGSGDDDSALGQGGSGTVANTTTNSGSASSGGGSDGAGAGQPAPPAPPPNPYPSNSVCDDPEGHQAYLLNEIFIREGHPFLHVDPAWANLVDQTPSINHWNPAGWNQPYSTENRCAILINDEDSPNLDTCDSNDAGRCHCWDEPNICRCDKMLREAQKAVCKMIFNSCTNTDHLVTRTNIFFAATVKYLTDGQMVAGQSTIYGWGGAKHVPNTGSSGWPPPEEPPPTCQASPLVLDLAGDGVHPSSLQDGTRYDLLGFGVQNTSWIKGDDALLALDRNGNGTIDDGAELFGAGTKVSGRTGCDGFTALAPLDTNGNGLIDAKDSRFADLRVWRDSNGDGVSQTAELFTLDSLRIATIGLDHTKFTGEFDKHGNELSMRGSYTRTDGSSGLVVDVYFVTGRTDK